MALEVDLERGGIEGENLLACTNCSRREPENSNDHKVKRSTGNKKHPKPPRPPRGPTLETADLKLIEELTRLALLKRAKIERIKELRKKNAAKTSSKFARSNVFAIAIMLTVLLFYLFVSQGILTLIVRAVPVEGTNVLAVGDNVVSSQFAGYSSANIQNWLGSMSPNLINLVALPDPPKILRRAGR